MSGPAVTADRARQDSGRAVSIDAADTVQKRLAVLEAAVAGAEAALRDYEGESDLSLGLSVSFWELQELLKELFGL